jgi:hypothetical protein
MKWGRSKTAWLFTTKYKGLLMIRRHSSSHLPKYGKSKQIESSAVFIWLAKLHAGQAAKQRNNEHLLNQNG